MSLATAEMKRAKLRFGLLAGAVGLLVFLILFQQALLGGLITQFIGALRNQDAEILVLTTDARGNLEGSRVPPTLVQNVRQVAGVNEAGPLGQGTFTVRAAGALTDATLFGYDLGAPGAPTTLNAGRLPRRDGEGVATSGAEPLGFSLGREVTVQPNGAPIRIVGLADDTRYSVTPTLFVSTATYEAAVRTLNPDATEVLPSAVAVHPDPGVSATELTARIERRVPDVDAYTRAEAVDASPGVAALRQSFFVILGLFYVVVPLVAGLFFLIITLQKANSLTLLRALGAPPSMLIRNLFAQVGAVMGVGVLVAVGLLAGAAQGTRDIGVRVEPIPILITATVVTVLALAASLAAALRILAIEPVRATTGGGAVT